MGNQHTENLLRRMRLDLYFNSSLASMHKLIASVGMLKAKEKKTTLSVKLDEGLSFRVIYPINDNMVEFSYCNTNNGMSVSSSECSMLDFEKSIKRVYFKKKNEL